MSFVTVRTGNDFLGTVFVQMFLQKSFLELSSTVILAQDFSVLAVWIMVLQGILKYQNKYPSNMQCLKARFKNRRMSINRDLSLSWTPTLLPDKSSIVLDEHQVKSRPNSALRENPLYRYLRVITIFFWVAGSFFVKTLFIRRALSSLSFILLCYVFKGRARSHKTYIIFRSL